MKAGVDTNLELKIGLASAGRLGPDLAGACGRVEGIRLTGVYDPEHELTAVSGVKSFQALDEFLQSDVFDALILATPVESRAEITLQAMKLGCSALVDGPISTDPVVIEEVASLVTSSRGKLVCGVVRPYRLTERSQKLKELTEGAFGRPHRVHWTLTNRFLPENFFADDEDQQLNSLGSLTRQLSEELDLLLWLCGEPEDVEVSRCVGKHHDAAVEDEIFARFAWGDGTTGSLIASSGEIPGIDRLELTGDRGMIVSEVDQPIRWTRCETSVEEFSRTTEDSSQRPPLWEIEIPAKTVSSDTLLEASLIDFVEAFRFGGKTITDSRDELNLLRLMEQLSH